MAVLDVTPAVLDLELYRGDSVTFELALTDDDSGEPLVLPGSGWQAQIRKTSGGEVLGEFSIDVSAAAVGKLYLTPPDLAVARYVWDLQCDSEGVRTYVNGNISVGRDVTRDDD